MIKIYKDFTFDSAHYLPNLPEDHKCRRMHGHTYHIRVTISGPVKDPEGWVLDFADIKEAFEPLRERLDHRVLNDIKGLENPTSEILSEWIWDRLIDELPYLSSVEVKETCASGCIFTK